MSNQLLIPSADAFHACIDQLWVFPIKSCAGVSLTQAVLTDAGLAWDRAWMVVDAQGRMVTQREFPRMVLIHPEVSHDALRVRAPGMPVLTLPLRVDASNGGSAMGPGKLIQAQVWNDTVRAFDMGDEAAQWFTQCLSNGPLRLVRFDTRQVRSSSAKWTQGHPSANQFSDGFPVLLASTASLDELNARLTRQGHAPVDMQRFRPNVVLRGLTHDGLLPHDENRVGPITIQATEGPVQLLPVKPCPRCPIPNIDPKTALATPVVSDTLQVYRQDARVDGAITFGMNALPVAGIGAVLRVGQEVSADWAF